MFHIGSTMVLGLVTAIPASALILNYGVDIHGETYTVLDFYSGSDDDHRLLRNDIYVLTLDMAKVFGPDLYSGSISSAYLYVYATDVDTSDIGNVYVCGATASLGQLAKGTDETVFSLLGFEDQLATSTNFMITFENASRNSFRVDGLNIQTDPTLPSPELSTMLLFGSGLVGLGLFGRKRFRK